ncbi:MAG: hypothetical protein C4583_04275 [Anaerolineaceae bacterium]|nr:MAG: hypothetical protein C4583_04275 [Anaerolineaceae bacterium]
MENLDGQLLDGAKQWKCANGHVLGVTERVKAELQVNGKSLRYFTTRLALFRQAVDLEIERPAEIEVCGAVDGRILSMRWRCSVAGCGCIEEWHPAPDVAELLASTYLAE